MADITCRRCGNQGTAIAFAPWPGALGQRIRAEICASCWDEWQSMQTKIINEYRLNVLDPGHAKAVRDQMEVYLGLKSAPDQA